MNKDFPAVEGFHSQFVNAVSSLEEIDGLSWKVSSFPSKGGLAQQNYPLGYLEP